MANQEYTIQLPPAGTYLRLLPVPPGLLDQRDMIACLQWDGKRMVGTPVIYRGNCLDYDGFRPPYLRGFELEPDPMCLRREVLYYQARTVEVPPGWVPVPAWGWDAVGDPLTS